MCFVRFCARLTTKVTNKNFASARPVDSQSINNVKSSLLRAGIVLSLSSVQLFLIE